MTEPEEPSRERLKHHFAQRVIHQARQVLEIWQRLQRTEWSTQELAELSEANLRLLRFAERFEQPEHSQLARHIGQATPVAHRPASWRPARPDVPAAVAHTDLRDAAGS